LPFLDAQGNPTGRMSVAGQRQPFTTGPSSRARVGINYKVNDSGNNGGETRTTGATYKGALGG
jgi:hypothetical protein